MLETINRIFILSLMVVGLMAICLGLLTLVLPFFTGWDSEEEMLGLPTHPSFSLESGPGQISATDSPLSLNLSIATPPLEEESELYLNVYSDGRLIQTSDCLEGFADPQEYAGMTSLYCEVAVPYQYEARNSYKLVADLIAGEDEYSSGSSSLDIDWTEYDASFLGFALLLGGMIGAVYLLVVIPLLFFALKTSFDTRHSETHSGEFSLGSLLDPLKGTKNLGQSINAFLVSPYFWALEGIGIVLILIYLMFTAEIWKSLNAFSAFILAGLAALIVPLIWSVLWWYADFKEREPLRILVTLFFWGMLCALMAIGLNTLGDVFLGAFGLSVLATFLLAPLVEEFFKGSGLCLISTHHEFDSVEDGLLFGFTIGMGFSFIENWLYFLDTPMGSDIFGWLWLFIMRSVLFSANHGFYTAITGAAIGWLIEHRSKVPALGLLLGWPVAAFFHAMHNSGPAIMALLGLGGVLIYCCFLIPFFDYGGLILVMALFIRAVLRNR
jgi:RsiW-degrading membrane proteinase PrsW (M82 family)